MHFQGNNCGQLCMSLNPNNNTYKCCTLNNKKKEKKKSYTTRLMATIIIDLTQLLDLQLSLPPVPSPRG